MHETLDNPIWNALNSRHAHLASRSARAACYPADVSPLAGLAEPTAEALAEMADLLSAGAMVGIFGIEELPLPDEAWLSGGEPLTLVQMVCDAPLEPPELETQELAADDVPEMLALVEATEPGPFLPRTIAMGRYIGRRESGALVAMAGERVAPAGYTEVSAVCTAPAQRGRGLAGQLVRSVGASIQETGTVPFLHVMQENTGAIKLYERLGFRVRRRRPLTLLVRKLVRS